MSEKKAGPTNKPNQDELHGAQIRHRLSGWIVTLEDDDVLRKLGLNPAHWVISQYSQFSGGVRVVISEK